MINPSHLHREEIKSRLRMRHGTLRAFEKANGLPDRSVKDVLRGRAVRRVAAAIAKELSIPIQAVSSKYAEELSTDGDNIPPEPATHRLNAGAR